MKRRSVLLSSMAIVISCLCFPSFVQAQGTTKVFAHEVNEHTFVNTLHALGTLKANEATTISVSVTEVVTAIHFDDGERVKAGDVLVEMASVEERALLEKAQFTMKEAEQQYLRVASLVEKNIATQAELDARRLAYDSAQSQLEATRSKFQDLFIIAPFDGVVGMRNISLGALVRPGDMITTLDDDKLMKLDMPVPSTYLPYLQEGMAIKARAHALGGKYFEGKISSIGSRVDPVTRSVQVRAIIPNPALELRPGLLMIVELSEPPRSVVVVPEKALIKSAGETFVFVVVADGESSAAQKRIVETGDRQPGVVEITEGLQAGEWVVTQGHLKLKHGSSVLVTADDSGKESLEALLKQDQLKQDALKLDQLKQKPSTQKQSLVNSQDS